MIVLPYQINETEFNVFIALMKDGLERIKEYDPAEIKVDKLGADFQDLKLKTIYVGYATKGDLAKATQLAEQGREKDIINFLARGWKIKHGDRDDAYESLKGGGEEPHG